MNAALRNEQGAVAHADAQQTRTADTALRIEWQYTYGSMVIEVRDGVAYVNGEPVEAVAEQPGKLG